MRLKTLLAVFLSLCAVSTYAQYRASIQGVATDPDGASVSGATVTLKNLGTNQTLTATTDANGIYNFNALPPSTYSVTVEKTGFKKKVLENVGFIPEQANALNIQLDGAQVIANGQQTENNGISIDGISTTSAVWGGSTIVTPSEDSVDSVKVVSNSYDAEDGRFSGAQIQIISKSGTNDFHGSLFLTTHQPNLNAYQRFNGAGIRVTRDNNKFEQFGGSVGGPIWKNKIFAFFSYETVREPFSAVQGNACFATPAFAPLSPPQPISAKYISFPGNGVVGTLNTNASCATAG